MALLQTCQCPFIRLAYLFYRGGSLRTHTDNRTLIMQRHSHPLQRMSASSHYLRDLLIKRIRKAHVSDNTPLKERKRPYPLRAIYNLIRDNEIPGLDLLSKRAYSTECNDAPHANVAQRGDICAIRNFVWGQLVVRSVTREESDWDIVVC